MRRPKLHLELPDRVRWYIKIRWLLVAGLSLPGILPHYLNHGFDNETQTSLLLLLIVVIVNSGFSLLAHAADDRTKLYRALAITQVLFDVLLITGALFAEGGIESRTVIAYALPILMSSAVISQEAAYFAGLASVVAYVSLIVFDYLGIITPLNRLNPSVHSDQSYAIRTILYYATWLLLLTIVTDFVGRLIRGREQLEEELGIVNTDKAQIEAILKTMGSALLATDAEARVTLVNDAFENLTGWKRSEVIGRPVEEVLILVDEAGKEVPSSQKPLLSMLQSSSSPSVAPLLISEYYYRRRNGSNFPIMAHVSPIVLNNQIIGVATVFDDATTTKEMGKLKDNFISLVSHQLKTPIGEMKGYVENLLMGIGGELTKDQVAYLESMYRVAERSNKLISNLLDMSILQHNNLRTQLKPVMVSSVITEVVNLYSERIKQKHLTLKVVEPNPKLTVMADSQQLVEVIGNLISNSISYSKRGIISIETSEDDRYGIIKVSDQGRGINPQSIQTLFNKERVLAEAPAAETGTGLGVYLAKQLVQLQKGQIDVTSKVGKGTSFTIKLPKKGTR